MKKLLRLWKELAIAGLVVALNFGILRVSGVLNQPFDWTKAAQAYEQTGTLDCFDGIDNNGNNAIDCADPACATECASLIAPALDTTGLVVAALLMVLVGGAALAGRRRRA